MVASGQAAEREVGVSGFPQYDEYDGIGLAGLVRAGEVTPVELVDEAIERIEARNPRLNAVVRPLFERARAEASARMESAARARAEAREKGRGSTHRSPACRSCSRT